MSCNREAEEIAGAREEKEAHLIDLVKGDRFGLALL